MYSKFGDNWIEIMAFRWDTKFRKKVFQLLWGPLSSSSSLTCLFYQIYQSNFDPECAQCRDSWRYKTLWPSFRNNPQNCYKWTKTAIKYPEIAVKW